ncbi:unnamed protein product [Mytilus edulis]|uniref:B box-type domain-containing protein n=1 Tax=Mytilus edulis TaxID=6550 RepID=A0A8S3VMJ5_MYTED|nr:unnamed protein product [Mytilus edulis]
MAAKYCEPCSARDMTRTAFKWCTECEEALCSKCTEAHKVQKMSRSHHLVEVDKIPKQINLSYFCSKHQHLPFDYFCVDHDVICCKECLPKNHLACKNVTPIAIASKGSKQSQSFLDSKEQWQFIIDALEKLRHNCLENNNRVEQEEMNIRKQIASTKHSIIIHLESLEKSLLNHLNEIKENIVTKLKRHEKDISDLVTTTNIQKESSEFVRDHGSEKQAFVLNHSSKPVFDEIENKVKQLTDSFAESSLTYVESISKEKLKHLGSIELTETPCSLPFVKYKRRQSKVAVDQRRQINSFTHLNDIDLKGKSLSEVTGITISDNNTLIFCDVNTNTVYFCDESGTFQSAISTPNSPWDIAAIPGTTTAVMSCRDAKYIQFIDIKLRLCSNQVKVKQCAGGIAASNDNIFVAVNWKIQVLDLHGNVKKSISLKHEQKMDSYICVCSNGNICYSCGEKIYCIKPDGSSVFFYDSSYLRSPRNMITDYDGNIYVLDKGSHNIHKLTSAGQLVNILLHERVSDPISFCFSKDLSKIYIANRFGRKISVFKTK